MGRPFFMRARWVNPSQPSWFWLILYGEWLILDGRWGVLYGAWLNEPGNFRADFRRDVAGGGHPAFCFQQACPVLSLALSRSAAGPGFLVRWKGGWQGDGAYPASISPRSLRRPVPLPFGRKAQAFCPAPLIPVLGNGGGLAGRPGDEGLSLHCSVPGPSSPQDGGFFCGVREGMFREEAGGSGGAASPAAGEWACVILRHIMFLTRKTITQRRGTPQTDAARNQPEKKAVPQDRS